jgi:hypothetical protein
MKLWVTEPNSIKIKLPGGDQFTCDLMNNVGNTETYLKWVQVFYRVLDEKKLRGKLDVTSEALKKVLEVMRKFLKAPKIGAALEISPSRTRKKTTLVPRTQQKRQKEQTNHISRPPPNCRFPISTHQAEIDPQVNNS